MGKVGHGPNAGQSLVLTFCAGTQPIIPERAPRRGLPHQPFAALGLAILALAGCAPLQNLRALAVCQRACYVSWALSHDASCDEAQRRSPRVWAFPCGGRRVVFCAPAHQR